MWPVFEWLNEKTLVYLLRLSSVWKSAPNGERKDSKWLDVPLSLISSSFASWLIPSRCIRIISLIYIQNFHFSLMLEFHPVFVGLIWCIFATLAKHSPLPQPKPQEIKIKKIKKTVCKMRLLEFKVRKWKTEQGMIQIKNLLKSFSVHEILNF